MLWLISSQKRRTMTEPQNELSPPFPVVPATRAAGLRGLGLPARQHRQCLFVVPDAHRSTKEVSETILPLYGIYVTAKCMLVFTNQTLLNRCFHFFVSASLQKWNNF